jgi:hypothetical protein
MMATPQNERETLILLVDKVERLIKLVEGNGKEGLIGRIDRLEKEREACDGELQASVERIEERVDDVSKALDNHLEETRKQEEKRNSLWERVGLEMLKMTLSILSALVIFSLTKGL